MGRSRVQRTEVEWLSEKWSSGGNRPTLSFEFFPPKDEAGIAITEAIIEELGEKTKPDFVTVTFGAGGTARGFSRQLVQYCIQTLKLPTIAHITSRDLTVREIDEILDEYKTAGSFGILALRGDPPKGSTAFTPHPGGFQSSRDMVEHIAERNDFMVAVAGYPEKHRDAQTFSADIDYLKLKIDAGASVIVTQMFFDNSHFYSYRDRLAAAGIRVPILAGIMPVANLAQVTRFIGMCGATLPSVLLEKLEAAADNTEEVIKIGAEHALEQCRDLLQNQIDGLHLYTLNRPKQILEICGGLNLNR